VFNRDFGVHFIFFFFLFGATTDFTAPGLGEAARLARAPGVFFRVD
jgi:hypothetical protein